MRPYPKIKEILANFAYGEFFLVSLVASAITPTAKISPPAGNAAY
jgi:hypothetical protein